MSARRCSKCKTLWPDERYVGADGEARMYEKCPECQAITELVEEEPIGVAEADDRRKHAEFDRYYAAREEKRLDRAVGAVAVPDVPPER